MLQCLISTINCFSVLSFLLFLFIFCFRNSQSSQDFSPLIKSKGTNRPKAKSDFTHRACVGLTNGQESGTHTMCLDVSAQKRYFTHCCDILSTLSEIYFFESRRTFKSVNKMQLLLEGVICLLFYQ